MLSRRRFCLQAASLTLATRPLLRAQSSTHPDVATIDHDRILTAATPLLTQSPTPITTLPSPRTPATPNDFYSEPETAFPNPTSTTAPWAEHPGLAINPTAFTQHRDALFHLGDTISTLTAAYVLTNDPRYATKAADHLRAWFLTPTTRMTPHLQYAQRLPNTPAGHFNGNFKGLVEAVPLAEIAQSIPFLASSTALPPEDLTTLHTWFADYLKWLTDNPLANLARDQKDHHASSWLLQSAACAHLISPGLTSDDPTLALLRRHFHTITLRAQIHATGRFPHELTSPTPYRDSLFNLDLLAAACDLLSTRFENPWDYELQDGPGMRAAISFHAPFIANRSTWPYPADAAYFTDLPGRRPALLLAGRALKSPQYTDQWRTESPTPAPLAIQRSQPLRQPLLWFTRPRATRAAE